LNKSLLLGQVVLVLTRFYACHTLTELNKTFPRFSLDMFIRSYQ